MNWPAILWRLRIGKKRFRVFLHLFATLLALTGTTPAAFTARPAAAAPVAPAALATAPSTVSPTTTCTLTSTGPTCPSYPPPALLNLSDPLGLNHGLYAATPAQAAALQALADQAVANVITDHGLGAGETNAVKTWGRDEAEAQLYLLLVQAVNTGADSRTADQKNAVAWITAVQQRQAVAAAQAAGLEYVKWAGLDQSTYQSLLASSPNLQSDLESFLSGSVQNYNTPDTSHATGGYCIYRSPAPYGTDYTGYTDGTCFAPCPRICLPPTPSYDQFVKWGEAVASYSLLNSAQFSQASHNIGVAVGVGLATGAAVAAGALLPTLIVGDAVATSTAIFPFAATAAAGVAGAFAVVLVVIVAIVIAVFAGIKVFDADKLPGQLAKLIADARTTPPDPTTFLSTTAGGTSLFSVFVATTLPLPRNQTCDNSPQIIPAVGGTVVAQPLDLCLNPTDIPPASGADPQFVVQAKGATTTTVSPTITWKDTAYGTTTTARLSGNWFITRANGADTAQALHIAYTDWDGKEQNAWLMNTPEGYKFLGYSVPADTSTSVDASNCIDKGICFYGSSINYVGSDGQNYSASVKGYTAPTGMPSYSTTAVEGSPVTFKANSYAPGSATSPVTYTWQFQTACGIVPCTTVQTQKQTICLAPTVCEIKDVFVGLIPTYTDPVSGDTASYTWPSPGNYQVSLTATDAHGTQANDTFNVAVGDVPPTVKLSPDCPLATPCDTRTGDLGTATTLTGTIVHAGTSDTETMLVTWGDGSNSVPVVTPASNSTSFTFSNAHTYASPGSYYGAVQVYDSFGGADSKPFTVTIQGAQAITFAPILAHKYGDAPFTVSATGGRSGKPVTFASSDTTACTLSGATSGVDAGNNGTGSVTVTLLKTGGCDITANQAGTVDATGTAVWKPAPQVTRPVFVQPATLTVTASSPSITYGETVPAITPSYSGFVNTESFSALTTLPACAAASNTGGAGTYATTCSGAAAANYGFDYKPGTLTIKPAPLTATANDKTMTYGSSVPAFDATLGGFLANDTSSVVGGLTCGAVDGSTKPVSPTTPVGKYPITCAGGTAANYALSYQPGVLTITQAATSLTLANAPAAPVSGQPVTITASVAVKSPGAGNPTGTVAFKDGTADLDGCVAQAVSTATTTGTATPTTAATTTATCTTSALSVGSHTLTASYSGDPNFIASSTAAASTQTVAKAATTVTLAPTVPTTQGQAVTFTAMVAVTAPGAGTPTGTVTFYDAGRSLGTGPVGVVDGKAQATYSTSSLGAGTHTITATYGGDGSFQTSASVALTQYVNTNLSRYPKLPSGGYDLRNANLSGGYFVGVSLVGANLTGANLTNAVFTGADLSGATLANSNFLTGANFTTAILKNANFSNSNLKSATFTGADLSGANFSTSNLTGASFTGASLSSANLTGSNMTGATGLTPATLTGVTWNKTACPDGTNSAKDGGTCLGHL